MSWGNDQKVGEKRNEYLRGHSKDQLLASDKRNRTWQAEEQPTRQQQVKAFESVNVDL